MSGQFKITLISAALTLLFSGSVSAQLSSQITADESFELNISSERITETNFERSTAVSIGTGQLNVYAGAAASATRIDVSLIGITGSVRFKASLEPLRDRIDRLRERITNVTR